MNVGDDLKRDLLAIQAVHVARIRSLNRQELAMRAVLIMAVSLALLIPVLAQMLRRWNGFNGG